MTKNIKEQWRQFAAWVDGIENDEPVVTPEEKRAAKLAAMTGEERAVLRTRMDGYCMEQTGLGLEEHRSQYLAETDGPAQGPRM